MGWAVDEGGEYRLAQESLGPCDQRSPRPELAVERLLHEHHHAHADPAAAHALRRAPPVVPRAGRKQYFAASGLALANLQPPRSRPASRYRPCTARDPR